MDNLKAEYNQVLQRYSKAAVYLDDTDVPITIKEKWIPEFQSIIKQLNSLIEQIEAVGQKMTGTQILEGFTEVQQ